MVDITIKLLKRQIVNPAVKENTTIKLLAVRHPIVKVVVGEHTTTKKVSQVLEVVNLVQTGNTTINPPKSLVKFVPLASIKIQQEPVTVNFVLKGGTWSIQRTLLSMISFPIAINVWPANIIQSVVVVQNALAALVQYPLLRRALGVIQAHLLKAVRVTSVLLVIFPSFKTPQIAMHVHKVITLEVAQKCIMPVNVAQEEHITTKKVN